MKAPLFRIRDARTFLFTIILLGGYLPSSILSSTPLLGALDGWCAPPDLPPPPFDGYIKEANRTLIVTKDDDVRSLRFTGSEVDKQDTESSKTEEQSIEEQQFVVGEAPQVPADYFDTLLGSFTSQFHLTTFSSGARQQELQGTSSRVYPEKISGFELKQRFREIVKIFGDNPHLSFQWLTIRPLSSSEDSLWFFSPALKTIRRLASENREDRVLRSAFSLDDISFFRSMPDTLRVREIEERTLLAPINMKRPIEGVFSEDGCLTLSAAAARPGGAHLLDQGGTSTALIANIMAQDTFLPREALVVTFEETNPYKVISQEVVVYDKELRIPLYRTAYDIAGRPRFSSYQFYAAGVGRKKDAPPNLTVPLRVYALQYAHEEDTVSMLTYILHTWCPLTEAMLDAYQPQKFASQQKNSQQKESEKIDPGQKGQTPEGENS